MFYNIFTRAKQRWHASSFSEKMLSYFAITFSVLALTLIVLTISQSIGFLIVQSPSMQRSMPAGALAIFEHKSIQEINPGDIILFKDGANSETLITHRAIEKAFKNGKMYFKTKGDSNAKADFNFVGSDEIKGRVSYIIPRAGWMLAFARSPIGLLVLNGLLAFFILLMLIDKIKARAINKYELTVGNDQKETGQSVELVHANAIMNSEAVSK